MAKNEIHFRNTDDCIKKIKSIRTMYRDTAPSYVALSDAIQVLEEIQQCRAIGTIEEFKNLKKKSVAKKPRFYAHNYYCIECGNLVGNNEFEWQRFLYCDKCGQKLDWQ